MMAIPKRRLQDHPTRNPSLAIIEIELFLNIKAQMFSVQKAGLPSISKYTLGEIVYISKAELPA